VQNRFELSGAHIGYIWGYVAFLGMVVQGLAIAPLTARWSEDTLSGVCLIGLAASHVLTGLVPTFKAWLAVMPLVALFGGVLRTCVVGSLTKIVAKPQVGAMLGLTGLCPISVPRL
jgi:predicted MFS family arabinose efflux permease